MHSELHTSGAFILVCNACLLPSGLMIESCRLNHADPPSLQRLYFWWLEVMSFFGTSLCQNEWTVNPSGLDAAQCGGTNQPTNQPTFGGLKTLRCCCCGAAASLPSRLLCSVTAVVCRQFSHMTGEGVWGVPSLLLLLLPESGFFLKGGWRARWLLWYCCVAYEWRFLRGGEKKQSTLQTTYEVCVVPWWHTAAQAYVAPRPASATQTPFQITYICCLSSAERLNGH